MKSPHAIHKKYMRAWVAGVCLYIVASFTPVSMPFLNHAAGPLMLDTLAHFSFFFVLGVLAPLAFRSGGLLAIVMLVTLLMSAAAEMGQIYVPNRFVSTSDLMANMLGCVAGMAAGLAYRRLRPASPLDTDRSTDA